jgi:hypothetical protein
MKSYTIKDFFKLNSPCYGCGGKVNIRAGVHSDNLASVMLNVSIAPAGYTIPLSITYHNNLKLIIEPKTNRYLVSNAINFIKYIKDHRIYLMVSCPDCQTIMVSHYLDFSLVGGYVKPVGLSSEYLVLKDKNNRYVISSEFLNDSTSITIFAITDIPISVSDLKLPLLPHYRFKDKEHFMAKIKTYLLFS